MQRRNLISKLCSNIYLVLVFLFLYAPILALVIFSFNDSKSMGVLNGFTMKWYVALFKNETILSALYYTVSIAVLASIISTIFGTITSIGIYKMRGKAKATILNINYLPVLNTDIVTGVALMSLFAFFQMNLSVLPKLRQLPDNVEEAALDLGATPWLAIRKIVIPQIKPGIMSGFLMAFTMSIDDFIISFFNTGNGVSNLSIEIYGMARRGIKPEINALSSLMFLTVLVLLILANRKDSIIKNSALGKA